MTRGFVPPVYPYEKLDELRAAADALSVCRVMGYEDALMRPYAQARTSLFEQSNRYSVTFDCVGSDDE